MSKPCDNCGADLRVCKDCNIYNGYITIPDNATNGDVIKTIFPNVTIRMKEEHNSSGWKFRPQIVVEFSEIERNYFDEVWWNAPYIKEQTNE